MARRTRGLRWTLTVASCVYLLWAAFGVLEPLYVRDVLGGSDAMFALLQTVFGVGLVLTGLVLAVVGERIARPRYVAMAMVVSGLTAALYLGTESEVVAFVGVFLWGVDTAFFFVPARTLLQRYAPAAFHGRVLSINQSLEPAAGIVATPIVARGARGGEHPGAGHRRRRDRDRRRCRAAPARAWARRAQVVRLRSHRGFVARRGRPRRRRARVSGADAGSRRPGCPGRLRGWRSRGRSAVVTGGASGIGRGTALELARRGADVVLADIHEERLSDTAAADHRARPPLPAGALRREPVTPTSTRSPTPRIAEFDHVDLVMNNAGISVMGPSYRVPTDDWQRILDVNVLGLVRGVNAFVPAMVERGRGYVVNTASIAGIWAYTWDCAPYITSKFAAYGYSEALARSLRPLGVGVSVLCPGLVHTNLG